MSAYLGDAQRGTPVSCRRGDKAAAMASYTKQAKDESLQYLAMRARAIRAGAVARRRRLSLRWRAMTRAPVTHVRQQGSTNKPRSPS